MQHKDKLLEAGDEEAHIAEGLFILQHIVLQEKESYVQLN